MAIGLQLQQAAEAALANNTASQELTTHLNKLSGNSAAELAYLSGAVAANTGTNKTLITGTSGAVAIGGTVTMADAANVVLDSTTGTKVGTATTQKLAFYNSTPIVQPSAVTQTYSTADATLANNTATDMVTTAATQSSPYGFAGAAQADAIATKFNALRVDVDDLKQFVNSITDKLQALGLIG